MALGLELLDSAVNAFLDRGNELVRVVLVPSETPCKLQAAPLSQLKEGGIPRVGVDLLELELVLRDNLTLGVEDDEARAGGALVDGSNEGDLGYCSWRHFVCCVFCFAQK